MKLQTDLKLASIAPFRENKSSNCEGKELQYFILDQTDYRKVRKQFYISIELIKKMRLIQHLTRVIPIQQKRSFLNQFKRQFQNLCNILDQITFQLHIYQQHYQGYKNNKQYLSSFPVASMNIITNKTQSQLQNVTFSQRMKKQIKSIQNSYIQTFIQGSLKRLNFVSNTLGLSGISNPKYHISQWVITNLKIIQQNKQSESFCCCFRNQ